MIAERNTLAMTGRVLGDLGGARYLVGRAVPLGTELTVLVREALPDLPRHVADNDIVIPLGDEGVTITGDPATGAVRFGGVLPHPNGESVPLHAVRVVDHRIRLYIVGDDDTVPDVFDRQIRAFGTAGQQLLRHLRVGVVGAGGTGSALCEQLIRLGVGNILTIDDDAISADGSNVTRVYGSTMRDIGTAKVDLIQRNADRIGLGTNVVAVSGTINDIDTARLLRTCDVVFGCTDDNRGRVTLSRLAYWYLIPVIDMGVQLDSVDGRLRSIDGRITFVSAGEPCLWCRGRIDQAAYQSELLPPEERESLTVEGYAIGLADRDQAVIAYTTAVAALSVAELLNRVFGLDDEAPGSESVIQFHFRRIGVNRREPNDGHWCADPVNVAAGDTPLFLGVMWTS